MTNLVLTAGHCFANHSNRPPGETDQFTSQDWEFPGKWYEMPVRVFIRVGSNDSQSGTRYRVTHYSIPAHEDLMMLRLERSVPRREALPAPVVTRMTGRSIKRFFQGKTLRFAGWGGLATGNLPRFRRTVSDFKFQRYPAKWQGEDRAGKVDVRSRRGSTIQGGDSGGPLYWEDRLWRMSSHPAVQQALRNHYFDSAGLPRLAVSQGA